MKAIIKYTVALFLISIFVLHGAAPLVAGFLQKNNAEISSLYSDMENGKENPEQKGTEEVKDLYLHYTTLKPLCHGWFNKGITIILPPVGIDIPHPGISIPTPPPEQLG
ncbi:MAG TPA: hypothetical protein PKC39_06410 [Ferruginibacter sp.]|nr:hypothetical protein [Ferruginibacter sp.]HMP20570.1 hypothetical protein [Ferruginibacter sp.]